jgi:hypothetical protein
MQSFWYDTAYHVENTKFQRLLDPCSDHGNSSFYIMRPNDYETFEIYPLATWEYASKYLI